MQAAYCSSETFSTDKATALVKFMQLLGDQTRPQLTPPQSFCVRMSSRFVSLLQVGHKNLLIANNGNLSIMCCKYFSFLTLAVASYTNMARVSVVAYSLGGPVVRKVNCINPLIYFLF
jgi:hypothetical protein